MTRQRVAIALGVVAVLAVLTTAAVAISTYGGKDDDPPAAEVIVVHDPSSGATFEVPTDGWTVRDAKTRIYYDDAAGDPVAIVRGPAVFRDGYCGARPRGSSRAFAGFTRQPFEAWVDAIGVQVAESRSGTVQFATVRPASSGPCVAREVEVAMTSVGDVRLVVVADLGEPDTLPDTQVETILRSLRVG